MTGTAFKTQTANPRFDGVFDIEPQEIQEKITKDASSIKLVDVRETDEYTGELGHIGGTELIVLNTIPQRLNELPKNQPVIFVCRSGGRSAQATAYALQNGFTQVYNMRGGMLLWNELNLPTQR